MFGGFPDPRLPCKNESGGLLHMERTFGTQSQGLIFLFYIWSVPLARISRAYSFYSTRGAYRWHAILGRFILFYTWSVPSARNLRV